MKNNKKLKIYLILLILLIVLTIGVILIIINKFYIRNFYENKNQEIVSEIKDDLNKLQDDEKPAKSYQMDGFNVIGIIKIQKTDIEYPILDSTTNDSMKRSISRYFGGDINSYGNVTLVGHNNYDGTMFGKNNKLEIGDTFELTDLYNKTIEYKIYDIFITDPNDESVLNVDNLDNRIVTLITCSSGHSKRLVIKAIENI